MGKNILMEYNKQNMKDHFTFYSKTSNWLRSLFDIAAFIVFCITLLLTSKFKTMLLVNSDMFIIDIKEQKYASFLFLQMFKK